MEHIRSIAFNLDENLGAAKDHAETLLGVVALLYDIKHEMDSVESQGLSSIPLHMVHSRLRAILELTRMSTDCLHTDLEDASREVNNILSYAAGGGKDNE